MLKSEVKLVKLPTGNVLMTMYLGNCGVWYSNPQEAERSFETPTDPEKEKLALQRRFKHVNV